MSEGRGQRGRPEWLETARIDDVGDTRQDHTHDWEFGPPDHEANGDGPPMYPRICADCGRLEWLQIDRREPRSYQDLYEQHHGDGGE